MNAWEGVAGAMLIALVVLVYILPAVVASLREHPQRIPIWVLSLALGWTLLGWAGAMVWACWPLQVAHLEDDYE